MADLDALTRAALYARAEAERAKEAALVALRLECEREYPAAPWATCSATGSAYIVGARDLWIVEARYRVGHSWEVSTGGFGGYGPTGSGSTLGGAVSLMLEGCNPRRRKAVRVALGLRVS